MSFTSHAENPAGLFHDLGLTVPKKSGNASIKCPLPGHQDDNPSFSLKVETGEFDCHGCGESGGPERLARLLSRNDQAACEALLRNGYVVSNNLADQVGRSELRAIRERSQLAETPSLTYYEYTDADEQLLYRVVRRELGERGTQKSFHHEHLDSTSNTWRKGRGGIEAIPFQLPRLIAGVRAEHPIYIAEGEKDVLNLVSAGVVATTNPGGASSWPSGWGDKYFTGAQVVVVVDRDEAGRKWATSLRDDLSESVAGISFVEATSGKDASDHLSAGHSLDQLRAINLDDALRRQWPEAIPLAPPPIEAMPLGDLPPVLREHVTAVATSHQVPTDLVLLADLSQAATVTQGVARVRAGVDWDEELCLFCIGVAQSGERKSAVLREASKPVRDFETERQRDLAPLLAQERVLHDVRAKRVESLKKKAAGAPPVDSKCAEADVLAAHRQLCESTPPSEFRLLADDVTPQALTSLLAEHGALGLISAEGGFFETLAGRYEQGMANIDVVLKAYDGESIRVDRIGREAQVVERPLLTIGLLVQPDVIETAARNRVFVGRGLISRLLLSWPESLVGRRSMSPAAISDRARVGWLQALRALVQLRFPDEKEGDFPHLLQVVPTCEIELLLSSEATEALMCFRTEVEPSIEPTSGRLASIASTASKGPGLAVRVAANLHLLEWGRDGLRKEIGCAHMRAGCDIVRVSLEHHLRLFGHLTETETLKKARVVLSWGSETPGDWHSQSDILAKVRQRAGAPTTARDLQAALDVLTDHGWAQSEETTAGNARKPGRPPLPKWVFRSTEDD